METKYSKGEWHPVEYAGYWNLQTEPFYGSRDLLNVDDMEDIDIAQANAKLASAAPELYEACLKIIELRQLIEYDTAIMESHEGEALAVQNLMKLVESALSKATL